MVTPQELTSRLAKAREPIKTMEETEEAPIEKEAPTEDEDEKTSDEEGSATDEDETEE